MTVDSRAPPIEQQVTLLARTLPDGRVWRSKYDRTRVLGRLVAAFAEEIARTFSRISDFVMKELDPNRTRQLILEWEESAGIPDDCFDRSADLDERRRRVVQKLSNFDGIITRADIEGVLADFGEQIQIVPGNSTNAVLLGFPAPPHTTSQLKQIKHTLAVRVTSDAPAFALPFPIEFATELSGLVQCLMRRITPANVALKFFFNQDLSVVFGAELGLNGTNAAPLVQDTIVAEDGGLAGTNVAPFVADTIVANATPTLTGTNVAPFVEDTIETAPDVASLDAWTEVATVRNGSPSFAISDGSNRLLVVALYVRAGAASPVTALSYGGQPLTKAQDAATTAGPDLDTAIWTLNEAGIAAASGTAFSITPNTTGVSFRLNAATYQNVDQTDPIVDEFAATNTSGGNPTTEALTSVAGGIAIAYLTANRGTSDGGATEDAAYSNMTERQESAQPTSYNSVADAATMGATFTPGTTLTHETAGHLLGISLRKA